MQSHTHSFNVRCGVAAGFRNKKPMASLKYRQSFFSSIERCVSQRMNNIQWDGLFLIYIHSGSGCARAWRNGFSSSRFGFATNRTEEKSEIKYKWSFEPDQFNEEHRWCAERDVCRMCMLHVEWCDNVKKRKINCNFVLWIRLLLARRASVVPCSISFRGWLGTRSILPFPSLIDWFWLCSKISTLRKLNGNREIKKSVEEKK